MYSNVSDISNNGNAAEIAEAIVNHEDEDFDDFVNEHLAIYFRQEATKKMEKQAYKMLRTTWGKLHEATVEQCVAMYVPELERGRVDPPNIVGIILEIKDARYRIGIKGGIISGCLQQNAFECVKYRGLTVEQVNKEEELS